MHGFAVWMIWIWQCDQFTSEHFLFSFFSRSLSVFVHSDWIRHFKFPMRQLSKHKIVNSVQKIYVSHNKKIMLFDFFSELWGIKHYLISFWFSVCLLRNVIVLCSYHICENKLFLLLLSHFYIFLLILRWSCLVLIVFLSVPLLWSINLTLTLKKQKTKHNKKNFFETCLHFHKFSPLSPSWQGAWKPTGWRGSG